MIVYHERFAFDTKLLVMFHEAFQRQRPRFSAKYQKEVTKEFINASKEVVGSKRAKSAKAESSKGAEGGASKGEGGEGEEEGSSDEDVMDRALDAMLDAQLGGFGEFILN
jgi:hypothetical protein